jgi:hypothetical protein
MYGNLKLYSNLALNIQQHSNHARIQMTARDKSSGISFQSFFQYNTKIMYKKILLRKKLMFERIGSIY